MRKRRFSRREEAVVERMIRDAIRELALERGSAEELHAIGWQAFLSVYHYDPVGFRWDGAGGWARAYQAVYDALSAYKKQRNDDYYRLISLDKPISGENETPLISRLPTHHGDFSQYVCLCDYLSRLPALCIKSIAQSARTVATLAWNSLPSLYGRSSRHPADLIGGMALPCGSASSPAKNVFSHTLG